MKLLVIDDSATIRKLVEISFRRSRFALEFAANGDEGVAKAAQLAPAAILLDYMLPDMRATEVCRRLSADERCAHIPIVLMSAKTELVSEDFRSIGRVVGFLGKPFSADDVLARINAAVDLPALAPVPAPMAPPEPAPAIAAAPPSRHERYSFKQKETAARALYHQLRRHLEALPEWARDRGEAPAGPFFARKLFTGDVVEGLLEELTPLFQELLAAPIGEPARAESSPLQHELERLRRPSGWGDADGRLGDGEQIYERAAAFSAKLRQVELGANEQRVLTVVDGRASLRVIAERTGLELRDVGRIIYRLGEIDLVQLRHTFRASSVVPSRTLAILERDREGVQQPLQQLLRRRPEPIELRDLGAEADLVGAIKRDRPCLVILNQEGAAVDVDIAEVAREIRHSEPLANISLAAVLERQSAERMDQLAAVGFDAVWVKPLHFRNVNQLIASSFLAADLVLDAERREHHGNNPHH